jgi:hypothetical protein
MFVMIVTMMRELGVLTQSEEWYGSWEEIAGVLQ